LRGSSVLIECSGVKDNIARTTEIVSGLPEDADFEAPLGRKLEQTEPLVV